MADYRLIHRNAATGARTSSLSHLGFRVWMQYQLSADDFGVCPALAAKLQGDNPALMDESAKRIQSEIEHLLRVGLLREFVDGKRRYLYQHDWQDWQRLRYPVATSLPPVPAELLRECSADTQELFRKHHARASGKFQPHASASDAHADASGSSEGVPGEPAGAVAIAVETTPPVARRRGYPDPFGQRMDPNAAAVAIVSETQQISIPGGWWERARRDRGLAFDAVDEFARWLAGEVRGGAAVGANKFAWLDGELARWVESKKRPTSGYRSADDIIAEQDRIAATLPTRTLAEVQAITRARR